MVSRSMQANRTACLDRGSRTRTLFARVVLTGGKPDEERHFAVGAAGLMSCVLCASARAEGPISSISGKMTHVAGDLAKTVTGEPVQTKQKEIVKDLDDLIASLEKQCQTCKNGMVRNNPTSRLPSPRFARAPAASAT